MTYNVFSGTLNPTQAINLLSFAVASRFVTFSDMPCLGVILQVRGHDGMSTLQDGAAAYSQSHVSHTCQGGFPLPSLPLFSILPHKNIMT